MKNNKKVIIEVKISITNIIITSYHNIIITIYIIITYIIIIEIITNIIIITPHIHHNLIVSNTITIT